MVKESNQSIQLNMRKKRFLQPKTGKTELYEDSFIMSKNWVVIGN